MIKKGLIPAEIVHWISMYRLSEAFGWKPEEIEKMDIRHLDIYSAIAQGIYEARKDK